MYENAQETLLMSVIIRSCSLFLIFLVTFLKMVSPFYWARPPLHFLSILYYLLLIFKHPWNHFGNVREKAEVKGLQEIG